MLIPFHKPFLPENLNDIFSESIKNGWLTTGPMVNAFEKELKFFLEAEYVIAVNSCTAALDLALAAKKFGKADKFLVPSYTFVASVEVGEYLSMQPVLVDCNKNNFNIDLNIVENELKKDKSIKTIIPVHFAGEPVDRKNLEYLGEKYNVFILEDAAHATETISFLESIKNENYAIALSFYANKNITSGGEGGALVTNNKDLSLDIRKLSLHGMSKDGWNRFKLSGKWKYDVSELGYKYNMNDISASFGLQQLRHISEWHQRRFQIVKKYIGGLINISGIICPNIDNDKHSWHLFILQLRLDMWKISRDLVIEKLNEKGIGTSVHYIPIHMHSYYIKKYKFKDNDFPNSNRYANSVVSLPLYPLLNDNEIDYIIDIINKLWKKFKV